MRKRLLTVIFAAAFALVIPFAAAGCKKDDKTINYPIS